MKIWSKAAFLSLFIFAFGSAHANLIINGGFELKPTGSPLGGGSGWNYYNADSIIGWQGDNIELWSGRNPAAYEGQYHAELNAHGANTGNWSISQTFATTAGTNYELVFAYSARRGDKSSSNEAFAVTVDNAAFNISDHVTNDWFIFTGHFVADDDFATLTFSSIFPEFNSVGNFLDDIRVTASPTITSVSEPNPFVLFAFAIMTFGLYRRHNRN